MKAPAGPPRARPTAAPTALATPVAIAVVALLPETAAFIPDNTPIPIEIPAVLHI